MSIDERSYPPPGRPGDTQAGVSAVPSARADDSDSQESLGDLIAATTRDLSALMRSEVELAKVEIKEEVAEAGRAGALMGAGALIGYLALLLVLLSVSWAIAEALDPWAGLLIVGVLTGAVAGVLIIVGRKKLAAVEAAPNTIETLQEDVQWAKQQLS